MTHDPFRGYDQWKTASPYDGFDEPPGYDLEWMKDCGRNPYNFYRNVYKGTACGPSIGMCINGDWKYCSDLPTNGWDDIELIEGVSVGSIVEGVDYDCDTITLDDEDSLTKEKFWEAVEQVNNQADRIWKRTHGCSGCFVLWKADENCNGYVPIDGDDIFGHQEKPTNYDDVCGRLNVHESCTTCDGEGVPM